MNKTPKLNPKVISIIVIVLIAVASTGVYALNQTKTSQTASTQSSVATDETTQGSGTDSSSTSTTPTTSTASSGSYKDGTYTKTGTYATPGGTESVAVTLTLANGIVTESSVKNSASRGDSAEYQQQFLSGYKQYVVGKSIDSISLSRVSGSSLTSDGFNRALESIKTDAEA